MRSQHRDAERNECHRLRYHVYFIPGNVQLKGGIPSTYRDFPTAMTTSWPDREAANMMETGEKEGGNIESEEGAIVSEMRSYFISSEIFKNRVLLLFYCIHLYVFACRVFYDWYNFGIRVKDFVSIMVYRRSNKLIRLTRDRAYPSWYVCKTTNRRGIPFTVV